MKKLTVFLAAAVLILSFGIANAGDGSKIPQNIQEKYMAATGTQATTIQWIPVVPELPDYGWTNYIIISNYLNTPVTVSCDFTNYSSEQTTKTKTLQGYSKKIWIVGSDVGSGTIYDAYCYASQLFGVVDLLFENGVLSTTMPTLMLVW